MVYIPVQRYSCICTCVPLQRRWKHSPPHPLPKSSIPAGSGLLSEGRAGDQEVCCALDATPAVVRKAVASGADMLVVHHTPLWTPLTTLTGPTAALMREILAGGLNVYVMHTNFDHAAGGVNDALAELLGLADCAAHVPGRCGHLHAHAPGNSREAGREPAGLGQPPSHAGGLRSSPAAVLIFPSWPKRGSSGPKRSSRLR